MGVSELLVEHAISSSMALEGLEKKLRSSCWEYGPSEAEKVADYTESIDITPIDRIRLCSGIYRLHALMKLKPDEQLCVENQFFRAGPFQFQPTPRQLPDDETSSGAIMKYFLALGRLSEKIGQVRYHKRILEECAYGRAIDMLKPRTPESER